MRKNQISFFLFVLIILAALIDTGESFLLCILFISLLAALLSLGLTRRDAKRLSLRIHTGEYGSEEEKSFFRLHAESKRRMKAASAILAELEIHNVLFDVTEHKTVLLCLADSQNQFVVDMPVDRCGQIQITCTGAWVLDRLKLQRFPIDHFSGAGMIIYPDSVQLQVQLSKTSLGSPREDGFLQNRKGNDLSEIYDIREYVPGDDIRAIHWKLSSKTDRMIVRQPSEPFHYNVVILPDFGLRKKEAEVFPEEINTAVAVGIALGEQLLRQGCSFCMAIPSLQGIQLYQVRSEREFMDVIPQWFAYPLLKSSGLGLDYFLTEHLQHYFTRVVILSAGEYEQDLKRLDQKVSVLILNAVKRGENIAYSKPNTNCEVVEIPVKKQHEIYRIVC